MIGRSEKMGVLTKYDFYIQNKKGFAIINQMLIQKCRDFMLYCGGKKINV